MTFALANTSGKRFMHHCDFNTVKYVRPGEQPNVARDWQISRPSDSHVTDRCWDPQDVKPPVQFPKNDPKVLKPMTSHNKTVFGWWLLCFQLSHVLFFMMHTCEHEIQMPGRQKWFSDIRHNVTSTDAATHQSRGLVFEENHANTTDQIPYRPIHGQM